MRFNRLAIAVSAILAGSYAQAEELETVTVSADLRNVSEQDLPASVDIKSEAELQDQGATHFDDVLLKTPNVNFSGQSSRARHIQVRGMGERDEYTGAPNASVGFAIDDIDFSGIGMVGNLFDVKQVEVLRGPQNTRYGQSAIGGLINIQTNDPTPYRESMIEATGGQDNLTEFGLMTSGPVNAKEEAAQYRIAVFKHDSDGFRENKTVDRTDTNGRDELTLRGKVRFFPNPDTTVDVSLIHADLNNGYDAWSRDNSFTTLSDQPGKDAQLSNAGSVKIEWEGNKNFVLTSKTSLANSDMNYAFDGDWKADTSLQDSLERHTKHRRTASQELRWTSTENARIFNDTTDWVMGLYGSKLEESNRSFTSYTYPSFGETYNTDAQSEFTNNKLAAYGQLDQHLNRHATLSYGLRVENNDQQFDETRVMTGTYPDSTEDEFDPNKTLWGASIHYRYRYNETHAAFTGVTKGFKAGGFNTGIANSPNKTYRAEALLNYEIGLKSHYKNTGLTTSTVLFYMDREDPQLDGYMYENGYYAFFTENFDEAVNYGLETEFNWDATKNLTLYGALGLIQTKVKGTPANSTFTISDREQAHAPNYQFNLGGKYRASNGFYAQADLTVVDKFYFDNVHNFESDSYHIINARLGYEAQDYEVYVWGKNLTDETYATRGYEFNHYDGDGLGQYTRLGDPHQLGVTARVYF